MRVVLDTNTRVSGVISPGGPPRRLVDGARAQAFELCSSATLLAELLDVLSRGKLIDTNLSQFGKAKGVRFPHHIVFINRTARGLFGNLSRLRAAAPWRRMLEARLS